MKIRVTEVEATAEELRSTRTLSEILVQALQRCLEPCQEEAEEDADVREVEEGEE